MSPPEPISPRVRISDGVLKSIEAHAGRDYPREACGFLLGTRNETALLISVIIPASNAESNPLRFYRVDPKAYLAAEEFASERGLLILGVYHSHPDSPPSPSVTDGAFAVPNWIYWIVPVMKGRCGASAVWYRSSKGEEWEPASIIEA